MLSRRRQDRRGAPPLAFLCITILQNLVSATSFLVACRFAPLGCGRSPRWDLRAPVVNFNQ